MFPALRMLFVFVLLGGPAAALGIPWSALRGNFDTMYRWAMATMRLGVRAAGVRVRVIGHENVPSVPSIIMSNHVSNLDPPILLPAIPGKASVMLKKSLMTIPLLGTAMRMGKFVPVARGRSREDAMRSVAAAADALRAGLHLMVFPEGTRSPDGQLLPFRKGAFFLSMETGAPVVPVVIHGTARMMERGSLRLHPGEATVEYLPARYPGNFGNREAFMEAVRDDMQRALERDREGLT